MDYYAEALKKHREWKGKIRVVSAVELNDKEQLKVAYTPGVAAPCLEIEKNAALSFELTARGNTVAVITDGTAVLGLGDIGAEAGMPVMEGKCALFNRFGGVNAIPICIRSKSVDEIVRTVELISGSFGGINLEDISAPRCFEIERRLKECCDIPIFHDDQHGTAIVVGAALTNAVKVVGKSASSVRVVVNGAGSAGTAISRFLMSMGFGDVVVCDKEGIISPNDPVEPRAELARITNPRGIKGALADALRGADALVGVSAGGCVSGQMVAQMSPRAIVFALANPVPEIMPDVALAHGAAVVGTGRSDFANQINNVLAFPGIFRGALDARAKDITEQMKVAAARAIASAVGDRLSAEYCIPDVFDESVHRAVAQAVAKSAIMP